MLKKLLFLFILSILLSSCVKILELTPEDEQYIFTYTDIEQFDIFGYDIKPLKNGNQYFFTKTLTNKGLSALYGVTLINEQTNEELSFKTNAAKFHQPEACRKVFKSLSGTTAIYETTAFDLQRFNADDGFYISTPDYFQLVLIRNTLLYSITMEGAPAGSIGIDQLQNNIIKKLAALEDISLINNK